MQHVNSPHLIRRRTEAWERDEQRCNAGVLVKEATRKLGTTFLPIEARCFEDVELCAAM